MIVATPHLADSEIRTPRTATVIELLGALATFVFSAAVAVGGGRVLFERSSPGTHEVTPRTAGLTLPLSA